jgi:hypothetical protein
MLKKPHALASDLIERTIPENPTAACKNTASPPKAAPCLELSIRPRENILTSMSLSEIFPRHHAVAAKRGGGYPHPKNPVIVSKNAF